jgi:anti-sigma regulatory factor (Ser/Thr protein kinase)
MVAFTLPTTPYSVGLARFYVRSALTCHGLGSYADNAEMIASELVTNAIAHADAQAVGLELTYMSDGGTLAIVVTDPCPDPPVRRDPAEDTEHGRGLNIVEALSTWWGWRPQDPGKAVYAILTREA